MLTARVAEKAGERKAEAEAAYNTVVESSLIKEEDIKTIDNGLPGYPDAIT